MPSLPLHTEAPPATDRFEPLARATQDAIRDWDLQANIIWWNEGFYQMFGYRRGDVEPSAESWSSRLHPEDRERVLEHIHQVIQSAEEHWRNEYRFRRADGSFAHVYDRGFTLRDASGKAIRMIGYMVDLTERRRLQQQVEEKEERLRIALETTGLGTFDYNISTGALTWDQRTKELFGLHPEAAVDYDIFLLALHPEDRPRFQEVVRRTYKPESGGLFDTEYRIIGIEDRKLRWIRATGRAFFNAAGEPQRLIGTVLDISEWKVAEERLQLQARVLESMDEGVSISDHNGIIIYTNGSENRMFGYGPEELHGRHVSIQNAYPEKENLQKVNAVMAELQKSGFWNGEWHNRKKDGSTFFTYSHITSLVVGERQLLVCVQRDITEEKANREALRKSASELEKRVIERTEDLRRTNEELARSNNDLEQFAYVASHDLQEPLRKIKTFAYRLDDLMSGEDRPEVANFLKKIISASDRMGALIDGLLNYSRLARNQDRLVPSDLNTILEEVISDFEITLQQKNGVVQVRGRLPVIPVIPLQINQLFYNLISNSLKFTQPDLPPYLAVDCRRVLPEEKEVIGLPLPTDYFAITFRDNGIGFEEAYADRIFTIFQRLHSRKEYEGTGIGLALCKKVVDVHHGKIEVRSKPNAGAAFVVYLPERQPPPEGL